MINNQDGTFGPRDPLYPERADQVSSYERGYRDGYSAAQRDAIKALSWRGRVSSFTFNEDGTYSITTEEQ